MSLQVQQNQQMHAEDVSQVQFIEHRTQTVLRGLIRQHL